MKRRTSPLPCRIFSYGCQPPTENAELVAQQLALARKYKNVLTELELHRRRRYREITGEHERIAPLVEAIVEAEAALEQQREAINATRKDARRRVEHKGASAEAQRLRAELAGLRQQRRLIQGEIKTDPQIQAALTALDAEVNERRKQERARCGVYWGTYLLIEAAAEQAAKSKTDPRFRRWDGAGRIGVQLQGGASTDDVMHSRSQLLQIDALPVNQWQTRVGRRAAKTAARIRVGSDGRAPIWASFPIVMHRPLPADGRIKAAWVGRRRLGTRDVFTLQIVVEAASLERQVLKAAPVAAINLAYRVRPDGLRVGYLVDEHDQRREIILPRTILDRLDHADHIQSIRDTNLDTFRARLMQALAGMADGLPEWMREEHKTLHAWRSAARFASLVQRWAGARFDAPGEPEAFALAESWRRQDRHLLQWTAHEARRALGHRRELYRRLAAELATRYSTLAVEQFDLRQVARLPKPEDEDPAHAAVRRNRQRASLSELRGALGQRVPMCAIDPANITHYCHACGSLEAFDAALHIEHTCGGCGATWDQDYNAARNLLARYRVRPDDPCEHPADLAEAGVARDSEEGSDFAGLQRDP